MQVRRLLSLTVLVFRGDRAKDAELLVLRHENAVLRRHIGRVRYEPADRVWFAALVGLIPCTRWSHVFPVTPATLLAWHRKLAAKKYDTSRQRAPERVPVTRPRLRSRRSWWETADGSIPAEEARSVTVQGASRSRVRIISRLGVARAWRVVAIFPAEAASRNSRRHPADPAFGDRVHARRPDVAEHGPDPGIGEDRVECGGEVRAAVADHELDPVRMLAKVHDQVAGLLGGPVSGGMRSDSDDADAPAGVLDHGQDIGLGAIEQVRCEEAAGLDCLGLGAQEQRPGRTGPPRRGIDAGFLHDLPYRRCRDSYPQPGQFAVDPAVAPAGVFAGQPQDQGPDVPAGGRSAGLAADRPGGPAAAGDVAVPAQDRVRGDQQPQPVAAGFRYHGKQGRHECPVRPVQPRAARLPSLQDDERVTQEQDLCGLPCLLTPGEPQPHG
jgi:hypothetical protein